MAIPALESNLGMNSGALRDYDVVRRTIEYLSENWTDQPNLDEVAGHVGLSAGHLQKLFTRWAGITPKAFLQSITIDHARKLLEDSASIMETSFEVGLSGPSRLHDLFVTHEAMTPGVYKAKGEGVSIHYGFHPSPFGLVLLMITEHGLAGLAFADEGGEAAALDDMCGRWPRAVFLEDSAATAPYAAQIFNQDLWTPDNPVRITLIGTDFEIRVWESLLRIPFGHATTYSRIAEHLGNPKASRAVGTAVGKNPISFVVPCHRVMGKSGGFCGYHWGVTRKQALIGWETGFLDKFVE